MDQRFLISRHLARDPSPPWPKACQLLYHVRFSGIWEHLPNMTEINALLNLSADLRERVDALRGYL